MDSQGCEKVVFWRDAFVTDAEPLFMIECVECTCGCFFVFCALSFMFASLPL